MMTSRGIAVLGGSIASLLVAATLNHLPLALLGSAGLAWLIAAHQSVSTADVTVDREAESSYFPEGTSVEVGYEVNSSGSHQRIEARQPLPQGVRLIGDERVDGVLGPDESLSSSFEVETPIRGVYHLPPVEVRTSDPFRLIEEDLEVESSSLSLIVTPRAEAPREPLGRPRHTTPRPGEFLSSNAGTGSEFYSIRDYQPSDPLRLVNWKASAQQDELMVNEFHDERVTQTVAILDHRRATGIGPFEDAPIHEVARGAAMAWEGAFQGGDKFIGMLLGEKPELLQGDMGRAFQNRVKTAFAEIEPEGAFPLRTAVEENLHAIKQGAKVILLSPVCYPHDQDGITMLLARECAVTVVVPPMPEPLTEEQEQWAVTHEENVKALRTMDVDLVEAPLGILKHAMGEGMRV